ncbi:MAG: flagellar export chaperone FlgN [Peptococcaceae bacterium]
MNKGKLLTPVLQSMAEGYRKQLSKYRAMLKLAEMQKKCTEAENLERLEEVISARQKLISELEEMNGQLRPLREDIMKTLGIEVFSSSALLEVLPVKAAENLTEVLGELGEILYAIKEMDILNENLLKAKLTNVNKDIKTIQDKNMAKKAYKKKISGKPENKFDKSK